MKSGIGLTHIEQKRREIGVLEFSVQFKSILALLAVPKVFFFSIYSMFSLLLYKIRTHRFNTDLKCSVTDGFGFRFFFAVPKRVENPKKKFRLCLFCLKKINIILTFQYQKKKEFLKTIN